MFNNNKFTKIQLHHLTVFCLFLYNFLYFLFFLLAKRFFSTLETNARISDSPFGHQLLLFHFLVVTFVSLLLYIQSLRNACQPICNDLKCSSVTFLFTFAAFMQKPKNHESNLFCAFWKFFHTHTLNDTSIWLQIAQNVGEKR